MHRILRIAGASVAFAALLVAPGLPAFAEETALQGVVNIDPASATELELLPGIGAARAAAVIAERESRGGFASVEELLEVKGIGEASLARMRPHLALEGDTTAHRE